MKITPERTVGSIVAEDYRAAATPEQLLEIERAHGSLRHHPYKGESSEDAFWE